MKKHYLFIFFRNWNIPAARLKLPLKNLAKELLRDRERQLQLPLRGHVMLLDPLKRLVELRVEAL